jgi:voltage-gated potassium channel
MPEREDPSNGSKTLTRREYWRRVIFDHDTPAGNAFDVVLIVAILGSVAVVMLDSLSGLSPRVHSILMVFEWIFTILFTIEYAMRIWCAADRWRYARSFYGIVDVMATLPTYISLIFPAGRFLALVRVLRVLRVFRILKLTEYVSEANVIMAALSASRAKITVFMFTVVTSVTAVGSLMYLVEGPEHGFTSIPTAMYWAIVTLTTVGFGDITPKTPVGQLLASFLMILGYAIIAVPTGIVTMEMQKAALMPRGVTCPKCGRERHDADAKFCKECGAQLPERGVM